MQTNLEPADILSATQAIEKQLGRERTAGPGDGPRTMDIDLLLIDDKVIQTPDLVIPHPKMTQRRFVLEPLFELAPDLEATRRSIPGRSAGSGQAGRAEGGTLSRGG